MSEATRRGPTAPAYDLGLVEFLLKIRVKIENRKIRIDVLNHLLFFFENFLNH